MYIWCEREEGNAQLCGLWQRKTNERRYIQQKKDWRQLE